MLHCLANHPSAMLKKTGCKNELVKTKSNLTMACQVCRIKQADVQIKISFVSKDVPQVGNLKGRHRFSCVIITCLGVHIVHNM